MCCIPTACRRIGARRRAAAVQQRSHTAVAGMRCTADAVCAEHSALSRTRLTLASGKPEAARLPGCCLPVAGEDRGCVRYSAEVSRKRRFGHQAARISAGAGQRCACAAMPSGVSHESTSLTRPGAAGAYGNVSLYKWKPGAKVHINGEMVERSGLVAVKSLLPTAAHNEQAIGDFKAEMSMLSRLSHSCLVGCIGSGTYKDAKSGEELLFLAMEAVTGGDLRNAVLKAMQNPKAYNDADVTRWVHGVARGLHYLHTRSPMIIHRDLKLENVLLDAQWNAKITDLGLIKALVRPKAFEPQVSATDTYEMTGGTGSLRYLSPENFLGKPYNEKSDIYSLSIILWELLARKPLLFMRSKRIAHGRVEYTARLWATDAAREGVRAEVLPQWPGELCKLMTQCWSADPASRPSAREIVEKLQPLLEPERFTDPSKAVADASGGCCAVQ